MNYHMTPQGLHTEGEEKIALRSVIVEAQLKNLLNEVLVTQTYQNLENKNIEAVYTFPLPVKAVLLKFVITIGERELSGVVVEKKEAEEQYEDAITDGDTAIMLQQIEPGMYTMNVGNIMPKETIKISFSYAELFKWQGNCLRFFLPTTIAPRYGNPDAIGMEPHQLPEIDFQAENRFQIKIRIQGDIKEAKLSCPTHPVLIAKKPEVTMITLENETEMMDWDFVLNIEKESDECDTALVGSDVEGYAMLTSFKPQFTGDEKRQPRSFKIIIDCSGSMGGDAIIQVRLALAEILDLLNPEDYFNIITFGSHYQLLFNGQVKVSPDSLKKAQQISNNLNADMGGTEMEQAIKAALDSTGPKSIKPDVLLITDGEIWDSKSILKVAKKSGHRFFTVGVGSSVSETFVQSMAEKTGGACELVAPNDGMSSKITRHFKRICLPRSKKLTVNYPVEPIACFPANIESVFDGDTVHLFSRFKQKPEGKITIELQMDDDQKVSQMIAINADPEKALSANDSNLPSTIARMAANEESKSLKKESKISQLSVKYQLISEYANYLVIDNKDTKEKASDLPELRKVPSMLAGGWGGSGSVQTEQSLVQYNQSRRPPEIKSFISENRMDCLHDDIGFDAPFEPILPDNTNTDFIENLVKIVKIRHNSLVLPNLEELGLSQIILKQFKQIIKDNNLDSDQLLITLLYFVINKHLYDFDSRDTERLIRKKFKGILMKEEDKEKIEEFLEIIELVSD
jgi:Ca-activated chloride channel homolog